MEQAIAVREVDQLQQFLKEKDLPWWAMARMGFEGLMLERTDRQLKAAEKIADIAMKGNTDGIDSLYPPEDSMGVSIGNTFNIYQSATASAPDTDPTGAPIPTPPVAPPANPVPISTPDTSVKDEKPVNVNVTQASTGSYWPWLLAGALTFGGGYALNYFTNKTPTPTPTTPPSASVDTDTDNETDVTFPK